MAKVSTTEAEKETPAKAEPVNIAPKFTLAKLRAASRKLFGISTSTFAGATSECDETKEYTVAEIREVIETWLKKEAK